MGFDESPRVAWERKRALAELCLAALAQRGAALMGVLNVTPDSFYDGGRYTETEQILRRVDELIDEGAEVIDIGGESSRPGSLPVPAEQQLERIEPAVCHAIGRGALVSVDTTSPAVADRMLQVGACIVNDVSCLSDVRLAEVTARHGAVLLIMHSRGPMSQMAGFSEYPEDAYVDVVADVAREWLAARDRAIAAGMPCEDVWFDPGLGFAKNARQSLELLARLEEFRSVQATTVVGPSRKSFIGSLDGSPPAARLGGTIAACLLAAARGASMLRVHDVAAVRQALYVSRAASPTEALGA